MQMMMRIYSLLLLIINVASCEKPKGTAEVESNIPSHSLRNDNDLDILLNKIGDARVVLLGEASHGTSEYYTWRAAISKKLIEEKGFTIIAVEGEWADSYRVNQFIKGPKKTHNQTLSLLKQYDRWPTWMWGNHEVADLVTWLNSNNQNKSPQTKAGFYGLDVYCLWESMQELMPYIQGNDSLVRTAQDVQKCFRPYSADPMEYAYAVAGSSANCRQQTERLWTSILNITGGKTATTESGFVMQQNALVALNGERYYRTSINSYSNSWNIRDRHMMQTLERLLEQHGDESKIIVWEHNTHIGDARYTDMASSGMVNVGQLARERFGEEQVFIVGFGSYRGTVIAADDWNGSIQIMRVPPAIKGSWEDLLHRESTETRIVFSNEIKSNKEFMKPIGHRAIGVVYDPGREKGNYVPSIIPHRYDAFIFIDHTKALKPLGTTPRNEPPETYPFGY